MCSECNAKRVIAWVQTRGQKLAQWQSRRPSRRYHEEIKMLERESLRPQPLALDRCADHQGRRAMEIARAEALGSLLLGFFRISLIAEPNNARLITVKEIIHNLLHKYQRRAVRRHLISSGSSQWRAEHSRSAQVLIAGDLRRPSLHTTCDEGVAMLDTRERRRASQGHAYLRRLSVGEELLITSRPR